VRKNQVITFGSNLPFSKESTIIIISPYVLCKNELIDKDKTSLLHFKSLATEASKLLRND
jgi:hypothetical protein